ncbi:MAG: hypothetical protein WC821_03980 [archaeon]|jgi:hypothetical protein
MNTFEIIIYAIVALALVMVFLTFAPQFLENKQSVDNMKKSIEIAKLQTMLGKTMNLGFPLYGEEFIVNKNNFDYKTVLVAFECLDPKECCIRKEDQDKNYKCNKSIEWDYDFFKVKDTTKIQTSLRCIKQGELATCKFYLGSLPAQAKIDKIELVDNTNGTAEIKVLVKNIGSNELAFGKNSLKLEKKSPTNWVETDYVSETKETMTIMPGESYPFLWSIAPSNSGEYKAIFTFEGQNAGFDENSIIFTLDTTKACKTGGVGESIFNPNNSTYQEIHYCANCLNSFDCASAWNKKQIGTTFTPINSESAYCTKTTFEGSC